MADPHPPSSPPQAQSTSSSSSKDSFPQTPNPCGANMYREDFKGETPGGSFLDHDAKCYVCKLFAAQHPTRPVSPDPAPGMDCSRLVAWIWDGSIRRQFRNCADEHFGTRGGVE
mmetsp:Transcript_36677/g.57593  ORF Transcript_36677/g.57593 Transcript_36677/m.57593 type:complete len:114 (-) Transcript_36677:138-479(-)